MDDLSEQCCDENKMADDVVNLTQSMSLNEPENLIGPKTEHESEVISKVFSLDSLREVILDYSIYTDKELLRSTICALRRVCKNWRETTTKILWKRKIPLYKISINRYRFQNSFSALLGKLLNYVATKIIIPSAKNCDKFPTFSLSLPSPFFQKEKYDILCNFLKECGSGLMELEISVPDKAGSLPCIFPKFYFPLLEKLSVNNNCWSRGEVVEPIELACKINLALLIQSIFNAAENLLCFKLNRENDDCGGFDYLQFPSTLKILNIRLEMPDEVDFQLLTRNKLHNLTDLTLNVDEIKWNIWEILESFKSNLRILKISEICTGSLEIKPLAFPIMPPLENVSLDYTNLELQDGVSSLQKLLPALKYLSLSRQTDLMFEKWIQNSKYPTVEHLYLKFVSVSPDEDEEKQYFGIPLETMQQIHLAFPLLHTLELIISPKQTCGLKYLFMEMTQLKELRIYFVDVDDDLNCDFGDSLFTGIPIGIIAALKTTPNFLDFVDLKTETLPSVKMLTGLTKLSVGTDYEHIGADDPNPIYRNLMSNLAFYYGFMKMASLKHLCLQGIFRPSVEMQEEWTDSGRTPIENTFCTEDQFYL